MLYVDLYNKRKKKHIEEKEAMKKLYEDELLRTQMEVQEQTLKTIAADIHDNVGQLLSITRLTLSTIDVQASPLKAQQKVDDALLLISNSIRELRQLASVLYAENLLAQGLENAVTNEVKWLSRSDQYEIVCSKTGERKPGVDAKKELISFRLIQELLNNIIKHANASKISIHFSYAEENLQVMIEDNGKGFNLEEAIEKSAGMGLHNLFKRAKMIGGELSIDSKKDQGTQALLKIPCESI